MSKEWIIEVLEDLKGFAATNDLPNLAEQLDEALVVAVTELEQAAGQAETTWHGPDAQRSLGAAR
jgi:hypothetical protein